MKKAASAIRAGQRLWAGELTERPADVEPVGQAQPAPEATDDEPAGCSDECGGCSCHLGNSAPCNHCMDNHDGIDVPCDECETTGRNCAAHRTPNPNQGDLMPKPTDDADVLAVLADVDKLTTTTDRATLTMPLTRLVDIDGTETVLAEAVVEVRLLKSGVMEALDDEDCMALAVEVESLERRLTPDGETAIRALAALLPPDADR